IVTCARKTIPGKPYHGIAVAVANDGRVFVEHVDDDSPAQQAGVREGDQLAKVGERAIAKKLDWLKAVSKLEIGDRLVMTLMRGETEIAAEMALSARR
nr:PDZ domain-containing protein [Planctomycetota bacterium]